MFWRIVRRLLTANYGRLFVILLALGAGAAVTSALLNLQIDAKRRLTTEFRALGANVIVAPRGRTTRILTAPLWMRIVVEADSHASTREASARGGISLCNWRSGQGRSDPSRTGGCRWHAGTRYRAKIRPGTPHGIFMRNLERMRRHAKSAPRPLHSFNVHAGDSLHLAEPGQGSVLQGFRGGGHGRRGRYANLHEAGDGAGACRISPGGSA